MADTVEGLVRELVNDPQFRVGGGYPFRKCPFCGAWLTNGMPHQSGNAIGSDGPIVCWLVRAKTVLETECMSQETKEKT